jgi:battenin
MLSIYLSIYLSISLSKRYSGSVYCICFIVGLFGGACYVNGFSLLAETVDPSMKEFSLSTASIADSFGIVIATSVAIFIQQSLYSYHQIHD